MPFVTRYWLNYVLNMRDSRTAASIHDINWMMVIAVVLGPFVGALLPRFRGLVSARILLRSYAMVLLVRTLELMLLRDNLCKI